MDNVELIDNYYKSLDEADILEIMEHISTEELMYMFCRDLDSVAMLRMLGAPEIENPDKVRQGRVVFPDMPSTIMDFMPTLWHASTFWTSLSTGSTSW